MNYDDNRKRLTENWATEVMMMLDGKTLGAGLLAYWHLMQTPVEGEEEPGGPVDERFTPIPKEELEQRLAALGKVTVEPLSEEIEELSDSGRFLIPDEKTQKPEEGTENIEAPSSSETAHHTDHSIALRKIYLESTPIGPNDSWKRRAISHYSDSWEETRRSYSAIFLVNCKRSRKPTPERLEAETQFLFQPFSYEVKRINPRLADARFLTHFRFTLWNDPVMERKRKSAARNMEEFESPLPCLPKSPMPCPPPSSYYERQNEVVHTSITIIVDNMGAAQDPNAALTSLIADATSFRTAETDDGAWSLLVTAPPIAAPCRHEVGGPRLAVMELPGAPPGPNDLRSDTNDDPEAFMRKLFEALKKF